MESLAWRLLRFGILDAEWGSYCLIRQWDEDHFRNSLRKMLAIPEADLPPDGHRAVMLCTDTDPYMPIFHPEPKIREMLQKYLRTVVRGCLEVLLESEFSPLNVHIQTRGLDVQNDFDLIQKFGNRVLLGMSIPTLDNKLAKIYEPRAPAPTRRLEVLKKAKAQGIPVYVAMAPTYPECDEADLRRTLTAFAELEPHTIFHEPINARAKNVDRILAEACRKGLEPGVEVARKGTTRIPYAIGQLKLVEKLVAELRVSGILHLWPDAELAEPTVVKAQADPEEFKKWIDRWHTRRSEWPGDTGPRSYTPRPKTKKAPSQTTKSDLTPVEEEALRRAVAKVSTHARSAPAAGKALRQIRDGKLYRPQSFDEFCRSLWKFSRQYGYNLIGPVKTII